MLEWMVVFLAPVLVVGAAIYLLLDVIKIFEILIDMASVAGKALRAAGAFVFQLARRLG